MRDTADYAIKSDLAIAAEKALAAAKSLPPGRDRLEALKQAGKLRNEAVLRKLAKPMRKITFKSDDD